MKARWVGAVERAPWALAAVASLGATLLVPSALGLLAPPEWLDAAVALGDRRLALALLSLFAFGTAVFRLSFHRRRSAEDDLDADLGRSASAQANGGGAGHSAREAIVPGEARSYLR
ncbi:MAG: hypothetical protein ACJ79H_18110 [Myxococcales bacterium]